MGSIKFNEFKFEVKDNEVAVNQFDKSMGMYEVLKKYPVSDLLHVDQDFTVKTYKTVVIPKFVMESLSAYLKSEGV